MFFEVSKNLSNCSSEIFPLLISFDLILACSAKILVESCSEDISSEKKAIVDFLPLSNVDYSGGIITTDWYNEGTASNESIKITVRFLTNEIRSDGLKIIVHKKKCGVQQQCTVAKISSALEKELQVAILKKAVTFEEEYIRKTKKRRPRVDK